MSDDSHASTHTEVPGRALGGEEGLRDLNACVHAEAGWLAGWLAPPTYLSLQSVATSSNAVRRVLLLGERFSSLQM